MAFNELVNKANEKEEVGGMNFTEKEHPYGIKKGEILGEMVHADGRVERFHSHVGQDDLNEFVQNLIVDRASILMAQHMKGDNVPGITHLAVGTGVGNGNTQAPQQAVSTATRLRQELFRKAVQLSYYDPTNSQGSTIVDGAGRTNVLDITVEFAESEAVGALTEMGLFGGTGASGANGGDMVNFKTFPVWNKPNNATLRWTWRLTF